MTHPNPTIEKIRDELYQIVDSFLVEAKDQNGNDRSLDRLNQDRHLAVDKLSQALTTYGDAVRREEREGIKHQDNYKNIFKNLIDELRIRRKSDTELVKYLDHMRRTYLSTLEPEDE